MAQKAAKENKKKINTIDTIESLISKFCKQVKTAHEKKMCYYIDPIKRKVSQPMSSFMPADRICKKLKKEAPEICQVREKVKVEKGQTDYSKLKVRDLKKILADRGVQCKNCIEKTDFIKRCEETEDLHDEL